jgi:hypothetical protein
MRFDGEQITSLLAAWRRLGKDSVFTASDEVAYIYDRKDGTTLQIVTPEGMRN